MTDRASLGFESLTIRETDVTVCSSVFQNRFHNNRNTGKLKPPFPAEYRMTEFSL